MSSDPKDEYADVDHDHTENIARGEMLRLLPLEIQARIFSFISVEERVRVLETISGGQAAGQRTQANFRRAVLESYKTVKNIKDFGTKWSKLKLLQFTRGRPDFLETHFPKLELQLDGSELQGILVHSKRGLKFIHRSGRKTPVLNNSTMATGFDILISVLVDSTSYMFIDGVSLEVNLLNLIDLSVKQCAPIPCSAMPGATYAAYFDGFVYVIVSAWNNIPTFQCNRYCLATDSWEQIESFDRTDQIHSSNWPYSRICCGFLTWDHSLYVVGGFGVSSSAGVVERYDPTKNKWAAVFHDSRLAQRVLETVVIQNMLYCVLSVDPENCCEVWKVDNIQTGKVWEKLNRGLPELNDSCTIRFYEKNGQVCMWLYEPSDNLGKVQWKTFVLDQAELTWRKVDICGIPTFRRKRSHDPDVENIVLKIFPLFL